MSNRPTIFANPGLFKILNNLYDVERKLALHGDGGNVIRNVDKIKEAIQEFIPPELDIFYEDPMGQLFKETRTDLDATITGGGSENLYVVEVIKPIIRIRDGTDTFSRVLQKGSVIVQTKNGETGNE
jgi:hypothetical protein